MVTIGSLRYDIIADTSQFQKGIVASRRELSSAKRLFLETRTPAESLGIEIAGLSQLLKKGAIDQETYNRSLKELRNQAKLAEGGLAGLSVRIKKIPSAVKSAALAYISLRTAMAGVRAIADQMQQIDETAKAARKLGETTEELIGLQLAASEFSGFSEGQLNQALQRMTRRVAEAAVGMGEAQDALVELGLDAVRLNNMSPAEAFREISEAMRGVEGESNQLRLAFKLFDSEGAGLVTTLNAGSGALLGMRDRAKDLGLAINDTDAAAVEEANDAITEARAAFSGLTRELAVHFSPAIKMAAGYAEWLASQLERITAAGESAGKWIAWLGGNGGAGDVRVIGNTQGTMATQQPVQPRAQIAMDEKSYSEEVREKRQQIYQEQRAAAESTLDGMSEQSRELALQVKLFGKSKYEQELIRFAAKAVTKEELKQAKALQANIRFYDEILQRKQELKDQAEKDAQAEKERLAEEAKNAEARKQLMGLAGQGQSSQRGSEEEFRLLARIRNKESSEAAKRHRETITIAKQQVDAANETNRLLAGLPIGDPDLPLAIEDVFAGAI